MRTITAKDYEPLQPNYAYVNKTLKIKMGSDVIYPYISLVVM